MRNIFIDWNTAIDQPEVAFMKKVQLRQQQKYFLNSLKNLWVMRHEFLGTLMLSKNNLKYSKEVLPGEIN